MEEDPCLKVERLRSTNEIVLCGSGDLHLHVLLDSLRDTHRPLGEHAPAPNRLPRNADSKEIAVVTATHNAFLKARPVVLEPIVEIEISVPDHAMGDITGDLAGRHGMVTGTAIFLTFF